MNIDYEVIRKNNAGIRPISVLRMEEYRDDLRRLRWSRTGFLNINKISRLLIDEAITAIGNGLDLLDIGYVDCACYSLRQAMELATTFVYLEVLPEATRRAKIDSWKEMSKKFPLRVSMMNEMDKQESDFKDLKDRMPELFSRLVEVNCRINKYIHKQGLDTLYEHRRHYGGAKKERVDKKIISDLDDFIWAAMTSVIVFQLSLDPMPILLQEDDVANRLPDFITDPYSPVFLKKYLGEENVSSYRLTHIYQTFREDVLKRPSNNEAVYWLKNDYYFDRQRFKEIIDQSDHLDICERAAVIGFLSSREVVSVCFHGGLVSYFCDVKSKRDDFFCFNSSFEFDELVAKKERWNIPYKGVYVSKFDIFDVGACVIEHNEKLKDEELLLLCKTYAILNNSYSACTVSLSKMIESIKPQLNSIRRRYID